jgi:hypothetical protein
MNATYPMTKLPIPAGVVVIRGIWLDRQNIEDTLAWAQEKLNTAAGWDRKFLEGKVREYQRALGKE